MVNKFYSLGSLLQKLKKVFFQKRLE